MPNLSFVNAEETVNFEGHVDLKEMGDYITFGCRSGKCGICAVRVLSGADNLSPKNQNEERLFALLEMDDPEVRLACQTRAHGDCVLFEIN